LSLRVCIYCRISKDREGEALGVNRQEEDCRKLADRLGALVGRVYIDNDISASTRSKKRRPEYEDMLEATRHGDWDLILSYSNSRLTRRPLELEGLIVLHERTGVRINTVVSGSDDLSTADGRMIARIKAAVDAAEAERTAERVARALQQRRENGKPAGGQPIFGYVKYDPEHGIGHCQIVDEVAAAAIRMGARLERGDAEGTRPDKVDDEEPRSLGHQGRGSLRLWGYPMLRRATRSALLGLPPRY
jgi:site-specific DNA recombinase